MRKRSPKKGFVYLLRSTCGKYYKYGASRNPKLRLHNINSVNPFGVKFVIIYQIFHKDIFNLEAEFKWFLWGNICDIGCLEGEYFRLGELLGESDLIKILYNKANGKRKK